MSRSGNKECCCCTPRRIPRIVVTLGIPTLRLDSLAEIKVTTLQLYQTNLQHGN